MQELYRKKFAAHDHAVHISSNRLSSGQGLPRWADVLVSNLVGKYGVPWSGAGDRGGSAVSDSAKSGSDNASDAVVCAEVQRYYQRCNPSHPDKLDAAMVRCHTWRVACALAAMVSRFA